MDIAESPTAVQDPVEQLNNILEKTWNQLCCTYDAAAGLPDIRTLFSSANLPGTFEIAQMVLVNMLLEVIENTGRFSPWYSRPARAFGLLELRNLSPSSWKDAAHLPTRGTTAQNWVLAPEAVVKWQPQLTELSRVIEATYPIIQAMLLVENLMDQVEPGDEWITAHCRCFPAREIRVTRSILEKGEILCDSCCQPFMAAPG